MSSKILNTINPSVRSIPSFTRDLKFLMYCLLNKCLVNDSVISTLTYFRNTSSAKAFVQRNLSAIKNLGLFSMKVNKTKKDYETEIKNKAFELPEIKPKELFLKSKEDQEILFSVSEKENDFVILLSYFQNGILFNVIDLIQKVVDYDGKGLKDFELTYIEAYLNLKEKHDSAIEKGELSDLIISARMKYKKDYYKNITLLTDNIIIKLDVFSRSNKTDYPKKMINDLSSILGFKKVNGSLTIDKTHSKHLNLIKNIKTKEDLQEILKKKKYTEKKLLERLMSSNEEVKKSLNIYKKIAENDLPPTHFEFKKILECLNILKKEDLIEISKNKIEIASQIQINTNDTIIVPDAGTTPSIADFSFIHGDFNMSLELTQIKTDSSLIRNEIIQCYEHLSEQYNSIGFVVSNSSKEKFNKYTFELNIGKNYTNDPRRLIGLSLKEYDRLLVSIEKESLEVIKEYYYFVNKNLLMNKKGYPWFDEFFI